jgi:N-acetylgalactosamine PTS system EIIA component
MGLFGTGWQSISSRRIFITVILLAHNGLAQALRQTVIYLAGSCPQLFAEDLSADVTPAEYQERIRRLVTEHDGLPILFLADIRGGTPWRVANIIMQEAGCAGRTALLVGMNLAMVLEACASSTASINLNNLADRVRAAAISDIEHGCQ